MNVSAGSPRTFGELIDKQSKGRPHHNALIYHGHATSYAALNARSTQLAKALRAHGIGRGDRVAILAKNSDEFVCTLLGCGKLGAVAVGLNWRLAATELRDIINDSQARLLFVGQEFTDTTDKLQRQLAYVENIVALDKPWGKWRSLVEFLTAAEASDLGGQPSPDDPVLQLYTSGTTGKPKGVILPHRAFFDPWIYQADPRMRWNNWQGDDVSLLAMPLFHVGGIGLLFMALRGGATTVITPEYVPSEAMKLIASCRVTRTFLVPAAIRALLLESGSNRADWSTLRYILYGAAPMPERLLVEAMAMLKCEFVQQYGMTEVSGTVIYLPPEDHRLGSDRLRAAGLPLPHTEIRIIDSHGNVVKPGDVGEITLRTPAAMLEYWGRADATAETLVDGYIHSGDAGYQDEDGYLYIFDRVKDMIVSGGENIYPIEVENALYNHPAVSDAAVIGAPDEKWGEAVTAVVVLRNAQQISDTELINHCKTQLASFKCPKKVVFIDELPRNASGKVLKKLLRDPYWKDQQRNI